ncbi:hypothetical protein NLI96_g13122 [Meripilus lineatus]|uniref:Uncharacterized protein n=1 Tax=Meripilus lineatus TaxID=2056292 RepID=A0AAD5Y986_9APHY|nr:hypothetical protein NLI96_g13122 [Physisporinus lineatus]
MVFLRFPPCSSALLSAQAEAVSKIKGFRAFEPQPIQKVWEGDLAPRIFAILDSHHAEWTSIGIVRFGWRNEGSSFLTLWIGVMKSDGFDLMNDQEKQEQINFISSTSR